jgi:hypothetical protein
MKKPAHSFSATVSPLKSSACNFTVVFLPKELEAQLPLDKHPRLRVDAVVAGKPMSAALQPTGGRWFLMLSRRALKERGLAPGDTVDVRFTVADQAAVDVPPELQAALDADPHALAEWEKLTPGKRRGHAWHVSSAKMPATRERRAAEVVDSLAPLRFPVPRAVKSRP